MGPHNVVRKCVSLVPNQLRVDILQAGKIGKRKIGQSPVKRIGRHSGDPYVSGYVVREGIEVLCVGSTAIEVKAKAVGELSDAADVGDRNIKAADTRAAANAWKGIRKVDIGSVIMESERKIITR